MEWDLMLLDKVEEVGIRIVGGAITIIVEDVVECRLVERKKGRELEG
jgi:hypothetical protein